MSAGQRVTGVAFLTVSCVARGHQVTWPRGSGFHEYYNKYAVNWL